MYPIDFCFNYHKLLNSRKLKNATAAALLNIAPATSSQFVSGKSSPHAAVLVDISNFFAVSLDWLTGFADAQPYNAEKLLYFENLVLDTFDIHRQENFIFYKNTWFLRDHEIAAFYQNEESRLKLSLESRAEILYCLNVLMKEPKIAKKPFDLVNYADMCLDYLSKIIINRDVASPFTSILSEKKPVDHD